MDPPGLPVLLPTGQASHRSVWLAFGLAAYENSLRKASFSGSQVCFPTESEIAFSPCFDLIGPRGLLLL